MGSGNIGSGNIGQIGDNLGIVNRPIYGGDRYINYQGGNTYYGGNNSWGGGGWGGGGWGGGGWGGGGWGGTTNIINNNFYGGGWAAPLYGNWYRGGWGSGGFWAGFGTGALTSFGLGALASSFAYPTYGFGVATTGFAVPTVGIYDYFPTWGVSNYAGWGLGSLASTALYSGYANPYYATIVQAQPATTVVYDYSQPINVAASPPAPSAVNTTEQVFSAARDAFKAGDPQRALELADQVLKDTPNVPVVHEFRALALFALKRYEEAAAVAYAVLAAGPGWNWSTLVGLYPDVDTYTDQLRALEAQVKSDPGQASPAFLLAYHYLIQGHTDAAAAQFEQVSQLLPNDQLSASFVKALKKLEEPAAKERLAAATPPSAPATASEPPPAASQESGEPQEPPAPPPPPRNLVGTWKAHPTPELAIVLTLEETGEFSWEVETKGEKQTLVGKAGFQDSTLALLQPEGPPLVGKVTEEGPETFIFTPAGTGGKTPGITFTKA